MWSNSWTSCCRAVAHGASSFPGIRLRYLYFVGTGIGLGIFWICSGRLEGDKQLSCKEKRKVFISRSLSSSIKNQKKKKQKKKKRKRYKRKRRKKKIPNHAYSTDSAPSSVLTAHGRGYSQVTCTGNMMVLDSNFPRSLIPITRGPKRSIR